MKDFYRWMDDQGKSETEEVDDVYLFVCRGCGKEEYVSWAEYENGDSGWYIDDRPFGHQECKGVCSSNPFCLP